MGRPVAFSQTMVVSRWFVMPMAAISAGSMPPRVMASIMTPYWLEYNSSGSCSTQPACG